MNEMPTNTQKLSLFSNFTKHLQVCCGLVMILFLSTLSWEANAQSVTIGVNDGNTTAIPISSCWEFSYTQQIVYASEINAAGDITSISFYYVNGSYDVSTSWDVYLGHTSQTTFASLSDWVDYTALESVFSGTVSFPAEDSWMTITFDNPFSYNGTDNLVIAVDENEPGYNCSINFGRISNVSGSNRGITYRSDSTNLDPASLPTPASVSSIHINIMELGGIEQSCPLPSLLTAIDINTTTATLEWTENGSATEWEVIYGDVGFDPESEGIEITVNINPEVMLTDLAPNTGYDFYVTSICGVDDESERVGPFSFWTNCIATDVPFTQNFEDVTVPAIPNCGTLEVISGNAWKTATVTSYGFNGKVLHYGYTSEVANSWYFTQGLNLETGMNYKIFYQYGNNSTSFEEKLKVAYGSSSNAAAMTEEIADHVISMNGSEFNETTFSVTTSGVYYLGFQAHSEADEFHLYLDNIEIIPLVECASVSVGNLVTEDMSVCS